MQQTTETCCHSIYPAVRSAWLSTSLQIHSCYASGFKSPHSHAADDDDDASLSPVFGFWHQPYRQLVSSVTSVDRAKHTEEQLLDQPASLRIQKQKYRWIQGGVDQDQDPAPLAPLKLCCRCRHQTDSFHLQLQLSVGSQSL